MPELLNKFFVKNSGVLISIVLLIAAGLFAAGKTYENHTELSRKIDLKVDQKLYDQEMKHLDQQLETFTRTLERLEGKLDAVILGKYKINSTARRNP